MRKLNIGIFSECYDPILNGVTISIHTFTKELEKRGHRFYIFAPGNHSCTDNPLNVFRYPSLGFPKDYPLAFPYLAPLQTAKISQLKLDIIHTQHMFAMGRLGLKLSRSLDIPIIHTYHTLISEYTHYVPLIPEKIKQSFVLWLTRSYCNACDQIVTPSTEMQKLLGSYGVATVIETIPTGIYLDDFNNPFHREVLETKWHIPGGKKILLYVSRIAKEKNLDFLFEVIKLIAKKRQDFHLLMVGGGPQLEYYKRKVKDWDMGSLVTFTGMQEKAKANHFFGACDIFVFPSITETQGIVITESMAAGIPAVAINEMGPKDLIQDGVDGFLTPLNVKAFSAKIEELLDNEDLRKKMGQQACLNAENFSAEKCASKMEKLYERTIDNHRS